MFDDQPTDNNVPGQVPNNLPIGDIDSKADDMFAGLDNEPVASALGAGILKPKNLEAPQAEMKSNMPDNPYYNQPTAQGGAEVYQLKQPMLSSGLVRIILAVVVLVIIGGGGWWIYAKYMKAPVSEVTFPADSSVDPFANVTTPEDQTNTVVEDINNPNNDVAGEVKDDQILFGQPIDKDGDGLDDVKEQEIGTDPNNWDSDNDGLSDGDEVLIWKTSPINPDTDNDTYLDGAEVKSGYNPNGPGKLFEPPKE